MVQEHILKLPTPRLVAYFKKHFRYDPYAPNDDIGKVGDEEKSAEFQADKAVLKAELEKREHVEK